MQLVDQFWLPDPTKALQAKLERYASQWPEKCTLLEIGTSYRERTIYGLRVGHGDLRLAVVAGMHSSEPFNSFGITAFIHSLLWGTGLDDEDLSPWSKETLTRQTIHFVPLVNVDGAVRFAEDVPDCWWPNRFNTDVWDELIAYILEPIITYGLERGSPGFNKLTEEQLREWTEERGEPLGWVFSDQGVDLWEDWQKFDAPETRALRDFLTEIQPQCVFELHNQETPTNMFVPIPSARGRAARLQMEYGEEMMTQLKEAGLPCSNHSTRTYAFKEHFQQFPDYVYLHHGCLVLFGEVSNGLMVDRLGRRMCSDPLHRRDAEARPLTQEEIIRTVWVWLKALVDLGNCRSYE